MSDSHSGNLSVRKAFQEADFAGRTALTLSSWFCAGLIPKAPGTCGTLAAIPVVFLLNSLGTHAAALFLILFFPVSLWASGAGQRLLEGNDPPEIVIDEVAGFLVTMSFLPLTWFTLVLGLFLFRAFDVLKPFPIRWLEKLGGGFGILLDDIMAGIYAGLCLRIVISFYAG